MPRPRGGDPELLKVDRDEDSPIVTRHPAYPPPAPPRRLDRDRGVYWGPNSNECVFLNLL